MKKSFITFLCAVLLSLPGSLFAATTPFVEAEQANVFADWTPNQLTSDVPITIYFPYSGNFNYWFITLQAVNDYTQSYYFETDDNTAATNFLGTIPAGRYNIDFQLRYGPAGFFDYTGGCDTFQGGYEYHTLYNVDFTPDCHYIYIDRVGSGS